MTGKPVDSASRKGDGAFLALVGKQFRIGQPRGVIDSDMHVFPADAALVALAGSIAGDAMADAVDAAELLDVDMDELAGCGALIADHRRARC